MDLEFLALVRTNGIAIPSSIGTVDAAVQIYLVDRFGDQARQWRRPPEIDGLVEYSCVHATGWGTVDEFGTLQLRSLGDQKSNLRMLAPKFPTEDEVLCRWAGLSWTRDSHRFLKPQVEKDLLETITNQILANPPESVLYFDPWTRKKEINTGWVAHEARNIMNQKLVEDANVLYEKKKKLSEELIELIFDRLLVEGIWSPPKRTETAANLPGNPGLAHTELVRRLAFALWADEIRQQDATKTWKEIAREVAWPYHPKLLQDARHRLVRAQGSGDPILEEAARLKEKLQCRNG